MRAGGATRLLWLLTPLLMLPALGVFAWQVPAEIRADDDRRPLNRQPRADNHADATRRLDEQPGVSDRRADPRQATHYLARLKDVGRVLELDPSSAHPWWIRATILTRIGRHEEALSACRDAVRIAPGNARYRLTEAQILARLGHLQAAKSAAEATLAMRRAAPNIEASEKAAPEIEALALLLLGDLIAMHSQGEDRSAIQHHLKAIEAAKAIRQRGQPGDVATSATVLVDAHLAVAGDIARGALKHRPAAVERWLRRADALARSSGVPGEVSLELQFRVGEAALQAAVALRGEFPPEPWLRQGVDAGEALLRRSSDPLRRRELQWRLGLALSEAVEVHRQRGEAQQALKVAHQAEDYLKQGVQDRRDRAAYALPLARLYYRAGRVHAGRLQDHAAAVLWYERALPLLDGELPEGDPAELTRRGQRFVSMGVSYWSKGRGDQALQLTILGTRWMELAVKRGALPPAALTVGYENLATIYTHQGDKESAHKYGQLAADPHKPHATSAQPVSFQK